MKRNDPLATCWRCIKPRSLTASTAWLLGASLPTVDLDAAGVHDPHAVARLGSALDTDETLPACFVEQKITHSLLGKP